MAWSYLALEPLIVARLQAQVPALVRVLTAADAVAAAREITHTPAAVVGLLADTPEAPASGLSPAQRREFALNQPTSQRWGVVLAVRNARDLSSGAAVREDAGPLIAAVLLALSGWAPEGGPWWPLLRVPGAPVRYSPGQVLYPLAFETRLIVTPQRLST